MTTLTTPHNTTYLFSRTIIIFTSIHQGHLHSNSCSISSYLLTFVAITTITMVINYSNYSNLGLSLFSIMLSIIADCNSTSYYHNTNIIKSMLILHTVELMSSLESLSCCHDNIWYCTIHTSSGTSSELMPSLESLSCCHDNIWYTVQYILLVVPLQNWCLH